MNDTFVEVTGAVDALREIIMCRAAIGKAADGEVYLICRACHALERLEIEGLPAMGGVINGLRDDNLPNRVD